MKKLWPEFTLVLMAVLGFSLGRIHPVFIHLVVLPVLVSILCGLFKKPYAMWGLTVSNFAFASGLGVGAMDLTKGLIYGVSFLAVHVFVVLVCFPNKKEPQQEGGADEIPST